MPAACGIAARDPRFDWGYIGEPEPHCDGRQILEHRGRVLGGSSAINGMVANRGNPEDYDGLRHEELAPGKDEQSDDEILSWLRANASTEYHPSSTCRMGTGENSVTNTDGLVHDTDALRVVDASIMPHNVTANLNAPVTMMAEKLADVIMR